MTKKYFPVCSTWIGRFNNRKYKKTTDEWTDENGKVHKETYIDDDDVNIPTDTFPNNGLAQAYDAIKQGFGLNEIEWDNSGGGASWDMLAKQFEVAEILIENKIELSNDELDEIDNLVWDDHKDGLNIITKHNLTEDDWFKLAKVTLEKVPNLALTLIKHKRMTPEQAKEIKNQLVLNAI